MDAQVRLSVPGRTLVSCQTRYERAGVASYWVVDPVEPSLQAFELRHGAYVEVANVAGAEQWTAEAPYAVTIGPAKLVG